MRHVLRGCLCALTAAALFGCGGSAPKKYKVAGVVSYDGKPISEGQIVFRPTDGTTRPEGSAITNGKYELRMSSAGASKVEITGMQLTDKKTSKGDPIKENYIPAAYNSATTLTAEVSGNGPNQLNFNLEAIAESPTSTEDQSKTK